MSTTLMTVPAAGWYPDPADAGHWRWWDGATWTDHVQAKVAVPVTAPQDIQPTQPEPIQPEASEPEPAAAAPAPAPVEPGSVPQPGSRVSAPGRAVAMTPETPVSDQMYWHSSAAEVIEVPRHHSPSAGSAISPGQGGRMPRYLVDWQDLGSPNTAGVWLLAFTPLLSVLLGFAAGLTSGLAGVTDTRIVQLIATAAVYVLLWMGAGLDIRSLRERGYRPPKIWWMLLLPPLAYLIARGKSVRREARRAWPPELVYVLNVLAVIGIVLLSGIVFAAAGANPLGA